LDDFVWSALFWTYNRNPDVTYDSNGNISRKEEYEYDDKGDKIVKKYITEALNLFTDPV
jgi:hypothetical protein